MCWLLWEAVTVLSMPHWALLGCNPLCDNSTMRMSPFSHCKRPGWELPCTGSIRSTTCGTLRPTAEVTLTLKSEAFCHFVVSQNLLNLASFASCHSGPSGTWRHPNGEWTRKHVIGVSTCWPLLNCQSWVDTDMDITLHKETTDLPESRLSGMRRPDPRDHLDARRSALRNSVRRLFPAWNTHGYLVHGWVLMCTPITIPCNRI